MGDNIRNEIAKAVAAAMARGGTKVVVIEPIVDDLHKAHPHLIRDALAEHVMLAVAAFGGAVSWPGKE